MLNNRLERSEIQGVLASGYGKQPAACYALIEITRKTVARQWLSRLSKHISFCDEKNHASKLNIAFSMQGLKRLITRQSDLQGFSREFSEGMVSDHRQRVLGDLDNSPSDPKFWNWGGPKQKPIHVLLMIYESSNQELDEKLELIRDQAKGVKIVHELRTTALMDSKEHFGFRDGISQPQIAEFNSDGPARDIVAAGEFILGYDDETGNQEPAPELGRNGSYLVFRQLTQDVRKFWQLFPEASDEEKIFRAAKMVGRWPDGTPLTLSPDEPMGVQSTNDFGFRKLDRDGIRCPFGAHIRRSNPRDSMLSSAKKSIASVKRHRLLRRGRSFGLPAPASCFPAGLQVDCVPGSTGESEQRGLYFLCLNASLARQFEFCQQTWLNNIKFTGVSNETDPIASTVLAAKPEHPEIFTVQAQPVRQRYFGVQKCIQTVGGEYFFLPSKSAIKCLAGLQEDAQS